MQASPLLSLPRQRHGQLCGASSWTGDEGGPQPWSSVCVNVRSHEWVSLMLLNFIPFSSPTAHWVETH